MTAVATIFSPSSPKIYLLSLGGMVAALLWILAMGLLPALLGGLFVYFIVEFGARQLVRAGVIPKTGRWILLAVISGVVITGVSMGVMSMASYVSDGPESIAALFTRLADIIAVGRTHLPEWSLKYIPVNMTEWQSAVADWLRTNAGGAAILGKEVGVLLIHIIIGMIIGGMIAVNPAFRRSDGPLAKVMSQRIGFLGIAFRRIVFSQIRISALNTFLTGIFLLVVMPLLGTPLPLAKTMVFITFIVGLLPIVGNLISNTVIFLVALSVSPLAAVGSLLYLITIHKLEYFFNAHIIGTQIKARPWEVLLAMLLMETAFGLAGLVAAPIYYAYLKDELSTQKLI